MAAAMNSQRVLLHWQQSLTHNVLKGTKNLSACIRKALKGESKDVIDNAFSVARATCMQEHCARRNLAQQSLDQYLVLMKADVNQLPYNLQSIMAALTYGKSEVLWYFRNVNEVCHHWNQLGNTKLDECNMC